MTLRKFGIGAASIALLLLCSCFARSVRTGDFGKSMRAEYHCEKPGIEWVEIQADMMYNSGLVMPEICFTAEKDAIHIDVTLDFAGKDKSSLRFPWRIPLSREINLITFGPDREVLWRRK